MSLKGSIIGFCANLTISTLFCLRIESHNLLIYEHIYEYELDRLKNSMETGTQRIEKMNLIRKEITEIRQWRDSWNPLYKLTHSIKSIDERMREIRC